MVVPADVDADSVRPGMIFFMDTGRGKGHAGVVVEVEGEHIRTIEGNTNRGGDREGFGVFERRRQLKSESLMGYLDFWSGDEPRA